MHVYPSGMRLNPLHTITALSALALALSAGCVKENQRITIGDMPLETFAVEYQNASTEPHADIPLSYKAARLDDMGWKEVDFPVPNDGVGHRPTYRTEYARIKKTPRQRRESPSAESALDLGEETLDWQLYEAFVFTPGILIYDTVSMPFRMVAYPGYKHTRYSPRFTYQRESINLVETAPSADGAPESCAKPACNDSCKCAAGECACSLPCGGK